MKRFFKKLLSFNLLFIIIGFHFVPIVFAGIIGEDTIIDYNKGQVRKKCSLVDNKILFTDESKIIYGITESGLTIKNNIVVKNSKNVPTAKEQDIDIDVIVIEGILEIEQTNEFSKKIDKDSLIIKNGKIVKQENCIPAILNPYQFKNVLTKPHLYKEKHEFCSVTKVESEIPNYGDNFSITYIQKSGENNIQVENRDLIVMNPIAFISEKPKDNIFGTMAYFCQTVKPMLTGYFGDYIINICNKHGYKFDLCAGGGVGAKAGVGAGGVVGIIGFILNFLKSSKEAVKEAKDIIKQTEIGKTLIQKIGEWFKTTANTVWSAVTSAFSVTGIVCTIVGALVVGESIYLYCAAVDLEEEKAKENLQQIFTSIISFVDKTNFKNEKPKDGLFIIAGDFRHVRCYQTFQIIGNIFFQDERKNFGIFFRYMTKNEFKKEFSGIFLPLDVDLIFENSKVPGHFNLVMSSYINPGFEPKNWVDFASIQVTSGISTNIDEISQKLSELAVSLSEKSKKEKDHYKEVGCYLENRGRAEGEDRQRILIARNLFRRTNQISDVQTDTGLTKNEVVVIYNFVVSNCTLDEAIQANEHPLPEPGVPTEARIRYIHSVLNS